jgi:hypothetical protein
MMLSDLTTDRQVFEYVKNHLLNQNMKSHDGADCLYRGPEGMSCAVGCLIDDDFYDESLEDNPAQFFLVISAVQDSIPNWNAQDDCSMLMLKILQQVHDNGDPYTWEHDLETFEHLFFDDGSDIVNQNIENMEYRGYFREVE